MYVVGLSVYVIILRSNRFHLGPRKKSQVKCSKVKIVSCVSITKYVSREKLNNNILHIIPKPNFSSKSDLLDTASRANKTVKSPITQNLVTVITRALHKSAITIKKF